MNRVIRGRPPLKLELGQVVEAVRRHGNVMAAARELHCSDAYIHVRFKRLGLTLAQVLEARDIESLLGERPPTQESHRC